jgi:EAL domain-containing protein (putative c-di-GMP-specific phosphodiesterase class I)
MSPALFVPMAEETGQIRILTDWVLDAALADQRRLLEAGHDLGVAVNISGRLLGDPDFTRGALRSIEAAVGQVCFEITETAVIDNPEVALTAVERFAHVGIAISIDDYGVGLSSLSYLKQIQADELKIDQSFILRVAEDERDAVLVRSTIDLAHRLNLEVTAEGIETPAALRVLREMGCDRGQGYYLARPMPLTDLLRYMDAERDGARTQ